MGIWYHKLYEPNNLEKHNRRWQSKIMDFLRLTLDSEGLEDVTACTVCMSNDLFTVNLHVSSDYNTVLLF